MILTLRSQAWDSWDFQCALMVWRRQLKLRLEVHLPKICMALQLFQTESQESVNSSSTDVTVNSSFHWTRRFAISLKLNEIDMSWLHCDFDDFDVSYFKVVVAHNREGELKSQDLVKTWSTFGINVVPQTDLCLLHSVVQPVLLSSPMQPALDKLRFYSCSWWLISQRSCLESLLAMPEEGGAVGKRYRKDQESTGESETSSNSCTWTAVMHMIADILLIYNLYVMLRRCAHSLHPIAAYSSNVCKIRCIIGSTK